MTSNSNKSFSDDQIANICCFGYALRRVSERLTRQGFVIIEAALVPSVLTFCVIN